MNANAYFDSNNTNFFGLYRSCSHVLPTIEDIKIQYQHQVKQYKKFILYIKGINYIYNNILIIKYIYILYIYIFFFSFYFYFYYILFYYIYLYFYIYIIIIFKIILIIIIIIIFIIIIIYIY